MTMTATDRRLNAAVAYAHQNPRPPFQCGEHYIPGGPLPVCSTGYWGCIDEHNRERVSKVHIRLAGEKGTLCGAHLNPDMRFHWCAHGVQSDYVECDTCQMLTNRFAEAFLHEPGRPEHFARRADDARLLALAAEARNGRIDADAFAEQALALVFGSASIARARSRGTCQASRQRRRAPRA